MGLSVMEGDDLGHAEEAGVLDALACGEDDLIGGEDGGDVGDDAAKVLGGGDAEDDVGLEDGAGKVGGDVDVDGKGEAGEVEEVLASFGELVGGV